MDWKTFISIGWKISEAVRENDDGYLSVEGKIPHTDLICMGKRTLRLLQSHHIRVRCSQALENVCQDCIEDFRSWRRKWRWLARFRRSLFPSGHLNVWENEHFDYHRHSPLVLGVEMDWKPLISIRCKISEAIRENNDGYKSVEGEIFRADLDGKTSISSTTDTPHWCWVSRYIENSWWVLDIRFQKLSEKMMVVTRV
jgi:hypothetical protein